MEAVASTENRIVKDALSTRLGASGGTVEEGNAASPPAVDDITDLDLCAAEFGGVEYKLRGVDHDTLLVSVAMPSGSSPDTSTSNSNRKGKAGGGSSRVASSLPSGAQEALLEAGIAPPLATLQPSPETGYTTTVKLDLTRLPPEQAARATFISKIASLRSLIMGAPLRKLLKKLANGSLVPEFQEKPSDDSTSADHSTETCDAEAGATGLGDEVPVLTKVVHRPGQALLALAKSNEEVLVVHPLHFPNTQDLVLVASFLQSLLQNQEDMSTKSSKTPPPKCSVHSPPCDPPQEVRQAPAHLLRANAGFVSFVIRKEHVATEAQLDKVCWSMCSFHAGVSAHVKGTRAFLHSRTRRRVDALSQALFKSADDNQPRE